MTALTQPRPWQQLLRHPLSAQYEDLDGPMFEALCESIKKNGFDENHKIILYEGRILDGWQRQRACVKLGIRPIYDELPKGRDAEAFVEKNNDVRRHEPKEKVEKRIAQRKERVAQARAEGKSLREIADQEGVSHTTIKNDLKTSEQILNNDDENADQRLKNSQLIKENGVSGGKGFPPETTSEETSKVTGRDGKKYSSTRKKPKAGRVLFDDRKVLKIIAELVRSFDARSHVYGKSTFHQNCLDAMEAVRQRFHQWRVGVQTQQTSTSEEFEDHDSGDMKRPKTLPK